MNNNLASLVEGLVPVAGMAAEKPNLARPPKAAMMSRSRRVVHVDPNEFHPTAVAAWTTANSWAEAVAPRAVKAAANQKKESKNKKQTPTVITTIGGETVSTGMSATTHAAIAKMNETIAVFEKNDKENQIKISALDKTIASIATAVARISESQDRITKGYIEIQEAFTKMAAANEATQQMMREFTSRGAITQSTSQSNSVISADDHEDMDTAVPGKRGASDIAKSPVRTRSQSAKRTTRPINTQSGSTLPCASFLSTSSSDSDLNTSSNSNETQGAGSE